MPLYIFKAKKLTGEELQGEREATHKRELGNVLRQEGYILIAATEKEQAKTKGMKLALSITALAHITNRVPLAEKLIFARNLSVMIGAGLSLTRALDTLERQTKSVAFKRIIHDITERIRRGESFTDALGQHPHVFSSLFIAMVSAGEVSGKLNEALNILAAQLQNDYELRRKVRGALIYPGVIIGVMIIIGVLMMIYVVPTLTSVFAELEMDLPLSTRAVIATSEFILNNGYITFGIFLAAAYGIFLGIRTTIFKRILDIVIVHLPVIGTLNRELNAARTSRTMSSLIQSGVSIVQTLTITHDVLQNHLFKDILIEAREEIQKGETMTATFNKHTNLYPVLVSEMIAVGEETGKTAEMLERLAEFYESEVAAATKDLSSIVEPVLMVLIGAFVGLFAISMIQPLYTSIAVGF
jgi:type IV pilus assembly protein PilC